MGTSAYKCDDILLDRVGHAGLQQREKSYMSRSSPPDHERLLDTRNDGMISLFYTTMFISNVVERQSFITDLLVLPDVGAAGVTVVPAVQVKRGVPVRDEGGPR